MTRMARSSYSSTEDTLPRGRGGKREALVFIDSAISQGNNTLDGCVANRREACGEGA
jgi:hypothetical protein